MIREAVAGDVPAIVAMGARFHEKGGIVAPYSHEATAEFVRDLIEAPQGVVFIGKAGMIGGALAPTYCADDWPMAVELFWWSEGGEGLRLLDAFETWGADMGAKEIRMTTLAGLAKAEQILSRRGYAPAEAIHRKAV